MEKKNVVDRKFVFTAVNPCKGTVYTQENAVVFCAKDMALVPTLKAYKGECVRIGCHREHIDSINLLIDRVITFQKKVEFRKPDTDTDCEIDRCIYGNIY